MPSHHKQQHLEVIVTDEQYPVRFFRSIDAGSYVPYHYHAAVEMIYLSRGSMVINTPANAAHHACMVASLPPLPNPLPADLNGLSFSSHDEVTEPNITYVSRPEATAATAATAAADDAKAGNKSHRQDKLGRVSRRNHDRAGDGDNDLLTLAFGSENSHDMSADGVNFALINSNEMHASSCASFNEAYVLQIPEAFLTQVFDYHEPMELCLDLSCASAKTLATFSHAYLHLIIVHERYQGSAGFKLRFMHALYALLESMMEMVLPQSKGAAISAHNLTRSSNFKRLQVVFDYLKHHYQEHITLQQMADLVHLHPGYFCEIFKEAVGMSPLTYLSELRLFHIYYDIAETQQPITTILRKHGYANAKKFYRIFKERFHQSPTAVRAQRTAATAPRPEARGYSYYERINLNLYTSTADSADNNTTADASAQQQGQGQAQAAATNTSNTASTTEQR